MWYLYSALQLETALRCFTILLSLTQTCFHPAHISTLKGAYNACCHYGRKALRKHIAIASYQVLIFYGWVNQSPQDGIAAHGASNPWPFGYESYSLTNCAITAQSNWYEDKYIVLDCLILSILCAFRSNWYITVTSIITLFSKICFAETWTWK